MKKQTYILENKPKNEAITEEMVKLLVPAKKDGLAINDTTPSLTEVYSSQKVENELDLIAVEILAKQNIPRLVNADTTALNNEILHVTANAIIANIVNPVAGNFYKVRVLKGVGIVGGVAYEIGETIERHFNGSVWQTTVLVNDKTDQTISGLKTFMHYKFGLRNIANTFTSFFTNSNTNARAYTLQNRSGTLADLTDIASRMPNPNGSVNFLSKFLTASTIGLSRLIDTGTFFGIGTNNVPTRALTLGNQNNKEIGIEESNSSTVGRDLIIAAGKTINYTLNSEFINTGFAKTNYSDILGLPNGNVLGTDGSTNLYLQTNGAEEFNIIPSTPINFRALALHPNNLDLFAIDVAGQLYKQTNGVGAWISEGITPRPLVKIEFAPNGDLYGVNGVNDNSSADFIYKRTNNTGNFVATSAPSRIYNGLSISLASGNIYVTAMFHGLFRCLNGSNEFNLFLSNSQSCGVAVLPNNNIIFSNIYSGITQVSLNESSVFNLSVAAGSYRRVLKSIQNGNVYSIGNTQSLLFLIQNNFAIGSPNLNGGTLELKAGTGKGTGQSRVEIITGVKREDGTNMQIETVRAIFDEDGNYTRFGTPIFADNASAIAGGLLVGMEYRTTSGRKMEVLSANDLLPDTKQNIPRLVNANTTAFNNEILHVTADATITDIVSAVAGDVYKVVVINGLATFGGQNYGKGETIERYFDGTNYITTLPNGQKYIDVTANATVTNDWYLAIVRIRATSTITIPTGLNRRIAFTCFAYPTITATFVAGAGETVTSAKGLVLKNGTTNSVFSDGLNAVIIIGEMTIL